jgi:hypothetical protein
MTWHIVESAVGSAIGITVAMWAWEKFFAKPPISRLEITLKPPEVEGDEWKRGQAPDEWKPEKEA